MSGSAAFILHPTYSAEDLLDPHRNPHRAGAVVEHLQHSLLNPVLRIGTETDLTTPIEALDRLEQRGVALLDQIRGIDTETAVTSNSAEHDVQGAFDVEIAKVLELRKAALQITLMRSRSDARGDFAARLAGECLCVGRLQPRALELSAHAALHELVAPRHAELLLAVHRRQAPELNLVKAGAANVRHRGCPTRTRDHRTAIPVGDHIDVSVGPTEFGDQLLHGPLEACRRHIESCVELLDLHSAAAGQGQLALREDVGEHNEPPGCGRWLARAGRRKSSRTPPHGQRWMQPALVGEQHACLVALAQRCRSQSDRKLRCS